MPAGSGPAVTKVTAVAIGNAEAVVAVLGASNFGQPAGQVGVQGNLVTAALNVTPGTGQTLITFRVRQGNGVAGTLVGITHPMTTVAGQQADLSFSELDTTAFAQAGQAQQYTVTAVANAAGPGAVNQGLIALETTSPVD